MDLAGCVSTLGQSVRSVFLRTNCHSERSEESVFRYGVRAGAQKRIPHSVRNDTSTARMRIARHCPNPATHPDLAEDRLPKEANTFMTTQRAAKRHSGTMALTVALLASGLGALGHGED